MDDIDQLSTAAGQENVHGALYPPYNNKAMRDANHMTVNNAGGWSVNNNMNQVQSCSSLTPWCPAALRACVPCAWYAGVLHLARQCI